MPDQNLDNGADPQDEAETFDETHREDELTVGGEDLVDDADIARDVYDVTTAIGDADDDRYAMEAADFPEDLDSDDLEEDEDDDNDLDDDLEDEPEDDDSDGIDDPIDAAAGLAGADEPSLSYVADLDAVTRPRDDEVDKYESTRALSDAQISDLGYGDKANRKEAETSNQPKRPIREERSFGEERADAPLKGSGATADDVLHEADADEDSRLDEGLEETFPASDPVSAKHIT